MSDSEIEAYENQYLLAHVIKRTEKLYKEFRDKVKSKNSGALSFRSFLGRKFRDSKHNQKIDMKIFHKSHFRTEEEREFYRDLLQLYQSENARVLKDIEIIRRRVEKVSTELKQFKEEQNRLKPEYETTKCNFENTSHKLEILREAKNLLKKDIFLK